MAHSTSEITAANVVSAGSWSTFTVAALSDRGGTNATTNALSFTAGVLSSFNFSLPTGAVPVGIVVITTMSSSNAGATASIRCRISKDAGSNWSAYSTTVTSNSTSYSDYTHGANNSLWGLSISQSELNDTNNFYVDVEGQTTASNRTCRLQYVAVIAYYTIADTITGDVANVEVTQYASSIYRSVPFTTNVSSVKVTEYPANLKLQSKVIASNGAVKVVGSDMTPIIGYNRTLSDTITLSDELSQQVFGIFRYTPLSGSTASIRVEGTIVAESVDADIDSLARQSSLAVTRKDADILPRQIDGYVEKISLSGSIAVKRLEAVNNTQKLKG